MHPELKKALLFLIGIAGFYMLFWGLLQVIDIYALKALAAWGANAILAGLGVPSQLVFNAEPTIIVGSVSAEINALCAGDIEIALLLAIVLATADRSWRQRAWGCIGGIATVMIANPLRIALVLAVGHYAGWEAADLAHDVLFRITLFIVIVAYYFLWYVKYDWFSAKYNALKRSVGKPFK